MKEKDLTVFGKVESGTVRHGDKLAIAPYGHPAQVIGLQDGKEQNVLYCGPGENVKIRIHVSEDE